MRKPLIWTSLAVVFGAALLCWPVSSDAEPKAAPPLAGFRSFKLPEDAQLGATMSQVSRALGELALEPWKPRVNAERERGAEDVYVRVAPATVVVRHAHGHGSGFVVDPSGWILTNHHVIENASTDPETGVAVATVHVGRLKGGLMQIDEQGLPAQVYKVSEEKDLALLKLQRLPAGVKTLPAVPLAREAPRPGKECVVLGHPRAGALWTLRRGEVANVANWPGDMIDVVMKRLTLAEKDRERFATMCAAAPRRKVLISSCHLNPGDSGGPLVNDKGELIGVSFAIPRSTGEVSLDKFSYHVHLDEVQAFLKDRPAKPLVRVPDPWPAGVVCALADLDEDGTLDTVVFGAGPGKEATGFLFDLKQASPPLKPADLADPVKRQAFKFAFALHLGPEIRAFYDTRNRGQIDLVLIDRDGDGVADVVLRHQGESWAREKGDKQRMIDPGLFEDRAVRNRFEAIVRNLGRKAKS